MEKSSYYSKNQLLSYNCLFNFVTGARGIGKTYQFKTWAISDFIRTGSTCWWIMRYQTEIDTIIKDGRFFADVLDKYPDHVFKIDGSVGYIGEGTDPKNTVWVPFITFKALSESAIKAISDPHCNKMVFDEFIPIPGVRYLKKEVERFLELYFTISRGRDLRAFFLANNVTSVCPYYTYFNVKPSQAEFTVDRDICIQNARTKAFTESMRETRFGKLIKGTHYADYAVENESLADTDTFITPMPQRHNLIFTIKTEYGLFNGYMCSPVMLYIKKSAGETAEYVYVFDSTLHDDKTLLDFRGRYVVDVIRRYYSTGLIGFQNVRDKSEFFQSVAKYLKI